MSHHLEFLESKLWKAKTMILKSRSVAICRRIKTMKTIVEKPSRKILSNGGSPRRRQINVHLRHLH